MLLLLMGLMSASGERMRANVVAIGDELTKTILSSGSGWEHRYGFGGDEGTFAVHPWDHASTGGGPQAAVGFARRAPAPACHQRCGKASPVSR